MEPKLSPRDLNKVPACHGRDETPTCEEDAWGGHEKVAQHGWSRNAANAATQLTRASNDETRESRTGRVVVVGST
jgi:hypothetical protein